VVPSKTMYFAAAVEQRERKRGGEKLWAQRPAQWRL